MNIDPIEQLVIYFLSLKDLLLNQYNNFISQLLADEYNSNLKKLGEILNLNLKDYELADGDKYFDPADTGFVTITGFIPISDSTSDLSFNKSENKYRKDISLQKLIQVIYIIKEKNKQNGNI